MEQPIGPGASKLEKVLAPGCELDRDGTAALVGDGVVHLVDFNVVGADVAEHMDEGRGFGYGYYRTDRRAGAFSEALDEPGVFSELEADQDAHEESVTKWERSSRP